MANNNSVGEEGSGEVFLEDEEREGNPPSQLAINLKEAIQGELWEDLEALLSAHEGCLDELSKHHLCDIVREIVSKDAVTGLDLLVKYSRNPDNLLYHTCVQAIHMNNFNIFQGIFKRFSSLIKVTDYPDGENSLLHVSASFDKAHFTSGLIDMGADVNVMNISGMTALGVAVTRGHKEVCQVLIDAGGLASKPCSIHLLMLATHLGHSDIVDLLLKCGLAQTESNQFKQNALMIASKKGHAKIVTALLAAGYDIECCDRFGYTPLMYSVVEGHIEVVRILLENGCDPLNKRWSAKDTALHFAASYGHLDITSLLLEYIPNPDVPDCIGITPLYLAAEEGHLDVVEVLAPRCNLYSMCGDKGRPLDAAVEYGHLDCLKYFLNHGDTVNMKDTFGRTPLMKAACRGHEDMVTFLLEECSEINASDNHGKTALSYAVLSMNPKCVSILLKEGASVNVIDSDDVSLLMLAIKVGQPAVVSLFILGGADLQSRWRVNRALAPLYPLELAVKQENFDVVQLLVRAGCTISLKDILTHWKRNDDSSLRYRLHSLVGQSGSTMSLTNENEAIKSYLEKQSAHPYSLKCHCRKVIWKYLPRPYWISVTQLPLPPLIKDYMVMSDCIDGSLLAR